MKGKGWFFFIGGSIAVILMGIVGVVIFRNLVGSDGENVSVGVEQTEAAQSQEFAGAGNAPGQGANQPGNQQGQNPGQSGNQGGNPPAQATQQPQNPGNNQPPQNAGQGSCTDGFEMDGYSNLALGEQFEAGDTFQVDWPIKNSGTCSWDSSYALVLGQRGKNGGALIQEAKKNPRFHRKRLPKMLTAR